MKNILFLALSLAVYTHADSQTVTVVDHRGEKDTLKGDVTLVDHRIGRDMSNRLVKPAFEDMPVYRLQLRVTTGRGNGAGTDDRVYVQLNDSAHRFFLAKGIDNFKEGSTVTYDIISGKIKRIGDIEMIKFGVEGGDGVCFKKVELFINNCASPVYSTDNGITSERGVCFDSNSDEQRNYTIPGVKLRTGREWNYAGNRKDMWRPPVKITKAWIVDLVEAAIGNQMIHDGGDLRWGTVGGFMENKTLYGAAVEASFKNSHTLSFDLDLERDLSGPNPEADIDFEVDFRCENGIIVIEAQNIKISSDLVGEAQTLLRNRTAALVGAAVGAFAPPLAPVTWFGLKRFLAFAIYLDPATPTISVSCKKTIVTEAGDIILKN
jgi:hypothetical protein